MSTYVLVHGAWHASWCWDRVKPVLEAAGHRVITPDLPGHGEDKTPFEQIDLYTYVEHLIALIHTTEEPVMLVGHSMAGGVISQVAEAIPHLIKRLIYLSAFIPSHGTSLFQLIKTFKRTGLFLETELNETACAVDIKKTVRTQALLFNGCSEGDAQATLMRLKPDPLRPWMTPVSLTSDRFGQVNKLYVACTEDEVIRLKDQRRMAEGAGCVIVELISGHAAFYFRALTELF